MKFDTLALLIEKACQDPTGVSCGDVCNLLEELQDRRDEESLRLVISLHKLGIRVAEDQIVVDRTVPCVKESREAMMRLLQNGRKVEKCE